MRLYLILFFSIFAQVVWSQKHFFEFKNADFFLDGKPFQIISGEMHPARIPKMYWKHRIQMAKAMGCNTIAAYFFWNYHEDKNRKFDFRSENRDVAEFIKICQQEGLWVIARPGPYVCAEWDFGGIPPYLLQYPDLKIRCLDTRYMTAVSRYVKAIAKELQPLQITKGGPILMLQIENEYGSFGNDKTYLKALKNLWQKEGISVPFYTADGPTPYMLEAGSVEGAALGLDSGSNEKDFETAKKHNNEVPVFSSETYPGWLTHWFEKWQRPDTAELKNEVAFLLKNRKSVNFYVIHGGTNFGFSAGANANGLQSYQPDITSYDYDAPISENGNATPKYHLLRNLIQQYTSQPLPPVPAPVSSIEIPDFQITPYGNIHSFLSKPILSPQPIPFEAFGQNQGIAIYKTTLIGHKSGRLRILEPHDFGLVFVDGKFVDTIWRNGGNWEVQLPKTDNPNPILEILMEGMGHINFAEYMADDRKGITNRVTLNGMTLMNWEIYPFDFSTTSIEALPMEAQSATISSFGNFFKGNFFLQEVADTFLDMSNLQKGYVFVNGHHLGRYWNVGPQQRLYCPANFLKNGHNEVLVFDFWQLQKTTIKGKKEMNR